MVRCLGVLVILLPVAAAPVPKDATPRKLPPNTNALLQKHVNGMKYDASSEWAGWAIGKLFDGDVSTSWFSGSEDAPTNGKHPWVKATFPEPVLVHRVTVLGNRESNYPSGYFATAGYFEFLDAEGDLLLKSALKSEGEKHDFDLELKHPLANVRAIRFTATADVGQMSCIGLSEMQVE